MDLTTSEELRQRAAAVIPGGANTLSKRPETYALGAMPAFIERGQGCHVWDADGNEYIDYIGALGPVTLGYCHPEVDAAIAEQLKKGILFPFGHPLEVTVSEKLCQVLPGADWVRLLKTGAEATSAAIRIARAATGKEVVLNYGYHGWHDNWTAERAAPADKGVPAVLKELIVPFTLGAKDERSLAAALEKNKGNVAAIIMEPISYQHTELGSALVEARKLADEHGVLLIFDEIVSGFRLARGGAAEKYGVTPDMACWAKGMANGMPLAAVTGRADLAPVVKEAIISSTYSGEALSLAAANACLDIYQEVEVIGHMEMLGYRLLKGLKALADEAGLKVIVGGHQQMGGYLFRYDDPKLNYDLATLFLQEMAERGVLIRRNGLLFISLSHNIEDIDQTLTMAGEAFVTLARAADAGSADSFLRTVEATGSASALNRFA